MAGNGNKIKVIVIEESGGSGPETRYVTEQELEEMKKGKDKLWVWGQKNV